MAEEKKHKGLLHSFSGVFWLMIIFEFFERGTYYGMMSILSVYLTDILHFSKTSVGTIKATIQPILYFLPIISGALADRFGYRRALLVAFTLLGLGYYLTSGMTTYVGVFLALGLMALGAGTFKPIISGTIARTTDKSTSSLGFGIYYWSINLGAFLFPLILVPYLKNVPSTPPWKWVIIAAAIGTGIMVIPTFLFFKEPAREKTTADREFNLIKTLANAFEIIYSPFILIYDAMIRSKTIKVFVIILTTLVMIYSGLIYFSYHSVKDKVVSYPHQIGDATLVIRVERDMSRENPFLIRNKSQIWVENQQLVLETKSLSNGASGFTVHPIARGWTLSVATVEAGLSDIQSLSMAVRSLPGFTAVTDSQLVAMLLSLKERQNNLAEIIIFKPGYFSGFSQVLMPMLLENQHFTGITIADMAQWIETANKGNSLVLSPEKELDSKFRIVPAVGDSPFLIEIKDVGAYASFRDELFQELAEYSELASISLAQLDQYIKKMKTNSFLLPFILILFISSLGMLQLEKRFKKGSQKTRALYSLGAVVIFMAIIWLMPNLSLFARIICSVIYLTLLSLFLIDYDDVRKFHDHFHFLLMIFLYSGFWVVYFQMYDSVLWYVRAYVDATGLNQAVNSIFGVFGSNYIWRFDIEHVTVINAGTIILLQLFVSTLVKDMKALPTMIAGILLGTLGMTILAISANIWIFIVGIIIFSIGEMTAHPKFISYIGQTAPRNRVALYMGYIFLYGVIGSSIGASLGASLYVQFVDNLNQPRTLWLIFSAIGVLTAVGLLLYNKFLAREK